VYLATDDCDGTAGRVTEAGGTLVLRPMDIMDLGRMAIARDPVGAQCRPWPALVGPTPLAHGGLRQRQSVHRRQAAWRP
jgi:hypothetical protein